VGRALTSFSEEEGTSDIPKRLSWHFSAVYRAVAWKKI
jgi:hypothetical protein